MGWKLLEELPKGRGKKPTEVLMILYVVFVASELHPDTIFLPKKISTLTKSLKKGFGPIKVDIHFNFLLTYSVPSQEFKYFS